MPGPRDQITVEIAVDETGDALAAYHDAILDTAVGLRLDHASGALTATLAEGRVTRAVGCGTVSSRMASRLRGLRRVLWARLEGEDAVAVAEVSLEHA